MNAFKKSELTLKRVGFLVHLESGGGIESAHLAFSVITSVFSTPINQKWSQMNPKRIIYQNDVSGASLARVQWVQQVYLVHLYREEI